MAIDPEVQDQLDALHALVKDNHRMLRAVRRDQWIGVFAKIIVWIILLALPIFLYQHYLAPIYASLMPNQASSTPGFFGLPSSAQLQNLIHSVQGR